MYGYISVNKPELKFKEFDIYRSYYCGLCESLKKSSGSIGQLTLSYDMTFLVLLLSSLYEPDTEFFKAHCTIHPVRSHEVRKNSISDYAADMNILLAYHKCIDNWNDDHKFLSKLEALSLSRCYTKVSKKWSKKSDNIKESLLQLSEYEAQKEKNIDVVSGCFGNIMSEIFTPFNDEWEQTLSHMGFYLGKFIYILDAFDDIDDDIKHNNYNVLKKYRNDPDFTKFIQQILNSLMALFANNFELLPIIQNEELLRNIIYSGVWTGFNKAAKKLSKENNRV